MGNITDLIKDVAGKNQIIETFAAKVIEINTETASLHDPRDAYTVNVMRADGAIIKNVRLKASILDLEQGIISIPKKDSWVLATIIDGVETRAFISQFSEVERTFFRFKNEENQYLEIDTTADKLQIVFKQKKGGNTASPAKPDYNNIAQIDFSGAASDPTISTTFYDENGKEISKNSFNLKEQKISINEGKTIFNLKDKEAKITIQDGFEAVISDKKTSFIKGNLTFEMDEKFKIDVGGKSLKLKLEELIDEIGKITVPTPVGPSGPPINLPQLTVIKTKLEELLK
ncbi:hypothetical protein [Flavobacterium reichenbachii]|uniref:Uncharacterized protein n=1 Tax=Flavobacterium reichenbachii TaxID=362418 RepID=A0A085ZPQ2_9FLAO|nr:hypothetical protein [Flavobacterium reichenbachii]KFF06416.1 hypothetical protein IW19_13245 [Flavobacterium reichenbachii]OXB14601.1 hypothetical protein B0A68_12230 [Flavobacterium reichenbachii]